MEDVDHSSTLEVDEVFILRERLSMLDAESESTLRNPNANPPD